MRISRVFVDQTLSAPAELALEEETTHYLTRVLRLRPGAALVLFNGLGGEYGAKLRAIDKKNARVEVLSHDPIERESRLALTLAQGIAKPDHMDWLIQKAVELGVHCIAPLQCEYTQHFDPQRAAKRAEHWRKIIINACMQCGRNRLPILLPVMSVETWLDSDTTPCRCVFVPHARHALASLQPQQALSVLIGPEGGLSTSEQALCMDAGYKDVHLGARILRTETAAVTTLAAAQTLWGDFF
jgi:16S rRNA (uracil1498-N3)-methyltransferase